MSLFYTLSYRFLTPSLLFDRPSVLCFKARPKKRPPKAFNARRTINILLSFAYSEDGFYATWIKAPLEGGQWSISLFYTLSYRPK